MEEVSEKDSRSCLKKIKVKELEEKKALDKNKKKFFF